MNWFRWVVLGSLITMCCWAAKPTSQLKQVEIGGSDRAELRFVFDGAQPPTPSWQIRENAVEVNFSGTEVAEQLASSSDIQSPHALVSRVRLFPARDGSLKVRVTINGSEQRLKERVSLKAGDGQAVLSIDYPKSKDPTLSLLKEEQQPIFSATAEKKRVRGHGLVAQSRARHSVGWGRCRDVLRCQAAA